MSVVALGSIGMFVLAVAVVALIAVRWYKKHFQVAKPTEAMVITNKASDIDSVDKSEVKVFVGGRRFVHPWKETSYTLNIGIKQIPVNIKNITTSDGIAVSVESVAEVAVDSSSSESILKAAKSYCGQEDLILHHTANRIEGLLRTLVAEFSAEDLRKSFKQISDKAFDLSNEKFSELGLVLHSISLQRVDDLDGYYKNLGRKTIAEVQKEAEIAESDADLAIQKQKNSNAIARAESDKARTDRETTIRKETASLIAEADVADELSRTQERARLVDKQKELAEKEAELLEAKYHNEVVIPARAEKEAERDKMLIDLDMRKSRDEADKVSAEVRIQTIKSEATAEAEAIKVKGTAEAEAIKAKGLAEVQIESQRIEAGNKIAPHIVSLKMAEQSPKIAEALAGAYKKVGNITIVGGGDSAGSLNSIVAKGIAQFGSTLEALTGVNPFKRKGEVAVGVVDEFKAPSETELASTEEDKSKAKKSA